MVVEEMDFGDCCWVVEDWFVEYCLIGLLIVILLLIWVGFLILIRLRILILVGLGFLV